MFYFGLPLYAQTKCVKLIYFGTSECSTKEAVMFFPIFLPFSKCKCPYSSFSYFDLRVFTQSERVKFFCSWSFTCSLKEYSFNMKVTLLRSWSIFRIFTMYSVLILGFLFWFVVTYPKCMCKSHFLRCCFFRGVPCI